MNTFLFIFFSVHMNYFYKVMKLIYIAIINYHWFYNIIINENIHLPPQKRLHIIFNLVKKTTWPLLIITALTYDEFFYIVANIMR